MKCLWIACLFAATGLVDGAGPIVQTPSSSVQLSQAVLALKAIAAKETRNFEFNLGQVVANHNDQVMTFAAGTKPEVMYEKCMAECMKTWFKKRDGCRSVDLVFYKNLCNIDKSTPMEMCGVIYDKRNITQPGSQVKIDAGAAYIKPYWVGDC